MSNLILVTGASGYIASRLIPQLLDRGRRVRALARRPDQLRGRAWFRYVDAARGEVGDPSSLERALQDVSTAYYFVHNMSAGRGYIARELQGARNFAAAAEAAGLEQVVYLGGLADPRARIAAHLRSRIQTGEILRQGRVPVTEFRAGAIIGPGSISFEMIRFMTELFPILPGPAWLRNRSQPIATRNVIDYLLAALENPDGGGHVFEIGGPEVIPYGDLMLRYARLRGLQRRLVTLPHIPLWLMALGVDRLTPVPAPIAHALLDGLRDDSRVREPAAVRVFPGVKLIPYDEAVNDALADLHPDRIEPMWRDRDRAVVSMKHEGFFVDHRRVQIAASVGDVLRVVAELGGRPRVFPLPAGEGPGVRARYKPGDQLDFYRVEILEPDRLLLRSELAAPGDAWIEWRVDRTANPTGSALTQTNFFAPRGLPGFLYWYLLYPFHVLHFRGLLRAIVRHAGASRPLR